MNETMYKRYHESFMENNHGSSFLHTFFCILYTVQCSVKISIGPRFNSDLNQFVYEYFLIILPMILVHTVLTEYIIEFTLIDTLYLLYKLRKVVHVAKLTKLFRCKNEFGTQRIRSISCLRGLTYLITVFSILAVDFRQFPRYLAKTERFGYSFMDTGVGLFAFMSGLVHKDLTKENYKSVLQGNMKFITILMILGITRFVSIKKLDYHEHVTEYGVHWNFFFSLAVCKLISFIVLYFLAQPLLMCISILVLHESLLHSSLQKWVFSNTPRISVFDANREGIASSLGYVAMYLFAVYLKQQLRNKSVQRLHLLVKLASISVLLCLLSLIVNNIKPTSRTLANSSYCLYVGSILVIILTLLYILEVLSQDKETDLRYEIPLILSNINQNGLIYFLISNLTTGFINKSMQTLLLPPFTTFVILNLYMIFNLTVIRYFNKFGISM